MKKVYKNIMDSLEADFKDRAIFVETRIKEGLKNKEKYFMKECPDGYVKRDNYLRGKDNILKFFSKLGEETTKDGFFDKTKIVSEYNSFDFENVFITFDLNIEHNSNKAFTYSEGYLDSKHRYGLADNISQILEEYGPECIVIAKIIINKKVENDYHWGGFRPHKWGSYIGNHDEVNRFEFLSETKLPYIIAFNAYKVKDRFIDTFRRGLLLSDSWND